MPETSKSSGIKTGRRKVEDSSKKKKTDLSKKKRQNIDPSQSLLDELGLNASHF